MQASSCKAITHMLMSEQHLSGHKPCPPPFQGLSNKLNDVGWTNCATNETVRIQASRPVAWSVVLVKDQMPLQSQTLFFSGVLLNEPQQQQISLLLQLPPQKRSLFFSSWKPKPAVKCLRQPVVLSCAQEPVPLLQSDQQGPRSCSCMPSLLAMVKSPHSIPV